MMLLCIPSIDLPFGLEGDRGSDDSLDSADSDVILSGDIEKRLRVIFLNPCQGDDELLVFLPVVPVGEPFVLFANLIEFLSRSGACDEWRNEWVAFSMSEWLRAILFFHGVDR